MITKQLTPTQSRRLAAISRTVLAQAYREVLSPYWDEFTSAWPDNHDDWFESLCIKSGDIAVSDTTDDPDEVIPKLLRQNPEHSADVLEHLGNGPDNFVLNMKAIAAAVLTAKVDTLPKPQPL